MEKFFVVYVSGHCGASCCWGVEEVSSWEEAEAKARAYNEERLRNWDGKSVCEHCGLEEPLQWDRAVPILCTGGWACCEDFYPNCEECQKYLQTY